MKVIIGAADTRYPGWTPTNKDTLDVLSVEDWKKHLPIEMVLAEHVWEHLTLQEGQRAALHCYTFVPRLRIAVPDGLFPNKEFRLRAKRGECEGDHLSLYTYRTLQDLFESVGYLTSLLEWWDETGVFHYRPWSPEEGMITRSLRFDRRNQGQVAYTSIILDAIRGLKCGESW